MKNRSRYGEAAYERGRSKKEIKKVNMADGLPLQQ
jgi:hypothetical protein